MTKRQAYRLAVKALLGWRKTIAFEAKLLLRLKIECPESIKAAKQYEELSEAICYLETELKKAT